MNPNNDLLIVIDFQNVYLPGEEWACPNAPEAVRNTCALIDSGKIGRVVFTRFTAPQQPVGTWNRYNSDNSEINHDAYLNEMIAEIQPYLNKWPVYEKSTYTSMRIPQLVEAAKNADRVLLAGVVAECCVLATMMEAIDDGYHVVYLTDCVAGQSDAHEECIRKIAEGFVPVHAEVMDSRTYLEQCENGTAS